MSHKLEIALAFDSGRESLALELMEWLDYYSDDDEVPAVDLRALIEDLLGWSGDDEDI